MEHSSGEKQDLNKGRLKREKRKEATSTDLQNDNYRLLVKSSRGDSCENQPKAPPNAAFLARRHSCTCLSHSGSCPPGAYGLTQRIFCRLTGISLIDTKLCSLNQHNT